MKTTEVLYTRNFTDLGPLQSAHILQYALTTDPGCALRYGVSVTVLQAGTRNPAGQSAIRRRGLAVFLFSCGKMRWSRAPCGGLWRTSGARAFCRAARKSEWAV